MEQTRVELELGANSLLRNLRRQQQQAGGAASRRVQQDESNQTEAEQQQQQRDSGVSRLSARALSASQLDATPSGSQQQPQQRPSARADDDTPRRSSVNSFDSGMVGT